MRRREAVPRSNLTFRPQFESLDLPRRRLRQVGAELDPARILERRQLLLHVLLQRADERIGCLVRHLEHDEGDLAARIEAYDRRRAAIHPYKPRDPARWGDVPFYGWSEDKARQYGVPQRADFGAFVRKKGFCLD